MSNSKKIDISIIVPIYNAEKHLSKCIDSLINQTFKNIEIILLNDGSTDNSEKIIKKYKDKRIKYFKNENQGIGKTRNYGIDVANGKYLMFVDSDDYLDLKMCELLYDKIEKDDLDIVVCNFYKVIGTKEIEEKMKHFNNSSLKNNPTLINKIKPCPWNKIYRTDLVKKSNVRFIENKKYEDAPFFTGIIKEAKEIGSIDNCLYYYVIHGNSETTIRDKRCFDILDIIDIIRRQYDNLPYMKEEINKLTVYMITNYTIQQRAQSDKKMGNKFIDDAFTYLKKEIPDYKNKKYYDDKGLIRRKIESNKGLSKLYCNLTRFKYGRK